MKFACALALAGLCASSTLYPYCRDLAAHSSSSLRRFIAERDFSTDVLDTAGDTPVNYGKS